jgi:hypothetical protein
MISAKAYAYDEYNKIFVQTFILLFIPAIYQGLLSMENDLRNPFGDDEIDFPRAAYRAGTFKRHQEYAEMGKSLPFHDKVSGGGWHTTVHKGAVVRLLTLAYPIAGRLAGSAQLAVTI